MDGRIFGRTVSKKVLNRFLTDCQKKFLTDCFAHFFGQFLGTFWALFGNFWQFWAIFGQFLGKIELFPWLFFVWTVTSDCLADKFGGRLEISTIRHRGWLRGSNRRPLPMAHPLVFRYISYSTTLAEYAIHRLRQCPAFGWAGTCLFLSVQ